MLCSSLFPFALLYFAIHLHIPASILCTVLSVQLSCLTLFCHSFTYTGILSLDCFVGTTVLSFFILPFIYIYRHPFSVLFCQYNCLALLYFAIHLHIPASFLCTVLSVQLSCLTLFCHSFTYTGNHSLYCFVSTTVLLYFILPFIYIYRHPFSELFCQYNCLALLYFAIHLHIPASCLLTVLSVQLSCFSLFCHSFTYTGILSLYRFVSTTVLLYFILPFIYIYRHPFSELFC